MQPVNAADQPMFSSDYIPPVCQDFSVGQVDKRAFFSPNFPDVYPNNTECVHVIEGIFSRCLFPSALANM